MFKKFYDYLSRIAVAIETIAGILVQMLPNLEIISTMMETGIILAVEVPDDDPANPDDPTQEGPLMWMNNKWGHLSYPFDRIDPNWDDELAVWRVSADEAITLFQETLPRVNKPVFETNSGIKLEPGTFLYGWAELLSGLEADSGTFVPICEPYGVVARGKEVEFVGWVDANGFLRDKESRVIPWPLS